MCFSILEIFESLVWGCFDFTRFLPFWCVYGCGCGRDF